MAFDLNLLRSERLYRNSAPAGVVMADLGRLRAIDAEMEEKKKSWNGRGRAFAALAALFFVGALITPVGPVGAGLSAVSFVAMVVCFIVAARYSGLDLENRRYELVARILQRLRKDIAPDEPVTVELDFRPTQDARYLTKRGKVKDWNAESFTQRWLSFQVRLRDGTHLRLGMEERLQARSRTRRNPRGKYKTKRKQKGVSFLHVHLRVKPERHPQLARLGAQARQAVRLPHGASLSRLDVAEDRLALRVGMARDWAAQEGVKPPFCDAPRAALMSLLSLYQVLNYSTALRKREPARASS